MLGKYDNCIAQWNHIFSEESIKTPVSQSSGNETLDKGIIWISEGTETILDFGCGNGIMLFLCARNGTKHHIGIDLSKEAIDKAAERVLQMSVGKYSFIHGSLEKLQSMDDSCVDAVILSNILDNLYPEDAKILLGEVKRLLRENGKVLVKLNAWVTPEQIKDWGIAVIEGNLLDDGMLLLNQTTEEWKYIFEYDFDIVDYTEVNFPEYQQINRMFYLTKR